METFLRLKINKEFDRIKANEKAMCDWRNADNREGAHSVVAVRLGRGKESVAAFLTSFCLLGGIVNIDCKFLIVVNKKFSKNLIDSKSLA